jgi:ATP-dependent HslUV protease subunit HslV
MLLSSHSLSHQDSLPSWHATTILAVRRNGKVVIGADGQVSLGNTVVKGTACKLRRLSRGSILAGFAGSTADAFTLLERLENKLEKHGHQLVRSCVELTKDWRTDKYLRRLEAMMIVADEHHLLVLTGNGDVLEPEEPVAAIGSGGHFALASARALLACSSLDAEAIVRQSMTIAADLCVYTNHHLTVEHLP